MIDSGINFFSCDLFSGKKNFVQDFLEKVSGEKRLWEQINMENGLEKWWKSAQKIMLVTSAKQTSNRNRTL